MRKYLLALSTFYIATAPLSTVQAAYIVQDDWFYNEDNAAEFTPQEHYNRAAKAMKQENWREAVKHFNIVVHHFPNSSVSQDAQFYLGVSAYKLEEFDTANIAFNRYLQSRNNPQYFEDAIKYKFSIAEHYRGGARRRPWGSKKLPKWVNANEDAIQIYDEVIAAMPSHDLSAQSLYFKGCLLWKMRDHSDSIDTFQTLIRRFPKHELTPQSYLNITKVLLDQSRYEFQNPDLLAHAEINVKKFEKDFPREELVNHAYNEVQRIKEVYASGLFETAAFYERINKPKAAVIYYEKAIMQFPETKVAQCCRRCLSRISPNALETIDQIIKNQEIAEAEKHASPKEAEFDPSSFSIEDFTFD